MKHTIFYIPGLGDGYDRFRSKALRFWTIFGVRAELIPMRWDDDEPYDIKFERVARAVKEASAKNSRVTLIGESAGGSMALNMFVANPTVNTLITIAGVNTAATPVAGYRLRRSPAFAESRYRVNESLRRLDASRRDAIHTVRATVDNVVRARHSQIDGAHNHRIWAYGHLYTITLCLTLLSGYIVYLAKQK